MVQAVRGGDDRLMYQNVAPPSPPQYPPPPPPPYPSLRSQGKRLRRSARNRRVAGVLGGLAEYLGVRPRVLRVIYVVVSIWGLAIFGGMILYGIAWALIPEEGTDRSVAQDTLGENPWRGWDRTARSWAIVLGALALVFIWSFGLWPWWHWRAVPAWALVAAVLVWVLARHSRGPATPTGPIGRRRSSRVWAARSHPSRSRHRPLPHPPRPTGALRQPTGRPSRRGRPPPAVLSPSPSPATASAVRPRTGGRRVT